MAAIFRNDLRALARLRLREARLLLGARLYDGAAFRHFPGLIASRRNYDVVQGLNINGQLRSAVLEQS